MQKSLLITGCSSGIGLDAAHGMRARGWRVFASCRKPEDCARLAEEGFDSPLLDQRDPEGIRSALTYILGQTGGTLDAVFNNGAFACPGAAEDLPTDALRDVFETNVMGVHELARQAIPIMRAQGHGRIVQHSSVLGLVPMPWRAAYTASKYALEGLTDTLRIEMADTNIHVITLNTGPVTSKIRENSIPHFEKWIDWENSPRAEQYRSKLLTRLYTDRGPDKFELPPSAVTEKLIKALESPRPHPRYFITTPTWIMSAAKRLLPTSMLDKLINKAR